MLGVAAVECTCWYLSCPLIVVIDFLLSDLMGFRVLILLRFPLSLCLGLLILPWGVLMEFACIEPDGVLCCGLVGQPSEDCSNRVFSGQFLSQPKGGSPCRLPDRAPPNEDAGLSSELASVEDDDKPSSGNIFRRTFSVFIFIKMIQLIIFSMRFIGLGSFSKKKNN